MTPAKRKRWREIVEVSAELFMEKGYEATSIQDVAEAVGMLKGSLYYYIERKEDLLQAIYQDVHEEARKRVDAVAVSELDALSKVRGLVQAHIEVVGRNLTKVTVYHQDLKSLDTLGFAEVVREREAYARTFRELIKAGQAQGKVCPDLDPRITTMAILGMANSLSQGYRPSHDGGLDAVAREYGDFVVAGLACTPETHEPGHRRRVGGANDVASIDF